MKKKTSLNAKMLTKIVKAIIKQFISSGDQFSFINIIKGKSSCWEKFFNEDLAIVKQLKLLTFSIWTDLKWDELKSIISKLN